MAFAALDTFTRKPLIHELDPSGSALCRRFEDGDGFTAVGDAVTCPDCRRQQADPEACASRSARYGTRCAGRRGHGGLHHSEVFGVAHAWTDEESPRLATDLLRVR
jgi:hypothetical protein